MTDESVAVLHGNYFQRGGGERVADAIAQTFDAPLYYGFGTNEAIPDDDIERIKLFDCRGATGWLAERVYQFRDMCFMAWSQHLPELYEYDTIIQSGNEFGWFVPKDDQLVVKYVHSPPRSSYDLFHDLGAGKLQRAYSTTVRTLYRPTTTFPDRYIANSELVQRRIAKYWGQDATVVYPPVDVEHYGADVAATDPTVYLTFNRLFRHKRTREIVEAFADFPDRRLIVGGEGPQREELEAIATPNVDVRGYLDEAEKRELLSRASALLYNPRNEDFGIIPTEAFASGTPVISIDDGYQSYQIADGQNGILYDDPTASGIFHAVRRFERDGVALSEAAIESFGSLFSRRRFERELRTAVDDAREDTTITGIAARVLRGGEGDDRPPRVQEADA